MTTSNAILAALCCLSTSRHINRKNVSSIAIAKARFSALRFFVDDLPAFTGPVKGLWEDGFQGAAIEPTSSCAPNEDDAKLTEQLHGHTLGNILTPGTITTPGVPNVQPLFDAVNRRMKAELDDHLYDASLVPHNRILQNFRNSNNQYQTTIAAQVLSQSCPNSGRALQMWPKFRNASRAHSFCTV